MAIHDTPHPLAGTTVKLSRDIHTNPPCKAGDEFRVEDWVDRVYGHSWKVANGNPAAMIYGVRGGLHDKLPLDDEVLYGKVGALGHLVHVSEIGSVEGGV